MFTKTEGSQSGGVSIRRGLNLYKTVSVPIRRGPIFVNPEGSDFCQSGGIPILPIRRGVVLSKLKKTTEKKVVKSMRLLIDRLGTSDCTGNLPGQ